MSRVFAFMFGAPQFVIIIAMYIDVNIIIKWNFTYWFELYGLYSSCSISTLASAILWS